MRGVRVLTSRRTRLVVLGLLAAACGGGHPATPAAPALPAGALAHLVPQPGEVPTGLILVRAQSGPADAARLAGFGGAGAAAQLAAHGFQAGYVAEYASRGGRTLTVVVSRFATAAGARADLAADLAGTTAQPGIGDQDGEATQALPGGPAGGQLDTERFRVGALTYLVAVGSPHGVDIADVRTVAGQLAGRGAKG